MKLRDDQVLVEGPDHSYEIATISETVVTYSPSANRFFEYAGEEYLEGDEITVTARVVQ